MDRMAKRTEYLAADHLRLSLSLQSLTDASQDTYATDANEVPLLNEGLHATAKHVSNCQNLLEDEARGWDQGVLEDLKRQRDALVSVRDMFDRRERYDKDNIPNLERRIQSNETKLVAIRSKADGTIKPGEIEKVTEAIIKLSLFNMTSQIFTDIITGQRVYSCPTCSRCVHQGVHSRRACFLPAVTTPRQQVESRLGSGESKVCRASGRQLEAAHGGA